MRFLITSEIPWTKWVDNSMIKSLASDEAEWAPADTPLFLQETDSEVLKLCGPTEADIKTSVGIFSVYGGCL